MKSSKAQDIREVPKVLGADTRIVRVEGRGVVVAAPRKGDDAVARLREHRLLVTPDQRAAGRRMQKYDRHALPARVPVPETGVGNLRHAILGRNLRGDGDGSHRIGDGLAVCRLDRACAERCQAGSDPDGPEERARWPGAVGGMALAHRRTCSLQYAHFLKDMRGGFNSLDANNHFAGLQWADFNKASRERTLPNCEPNQIPLVNE